MGAFGRAGQLSNYENEIDRTGRVGGWDFIDGLLAEVGLSVFYREAGFLRGEVAWNLARGQNGGRSVNLEICEG